MKPDKLKHSAAAGELDSRVRRLAAEKRMLFEQRVRNAALNLTERTIPRASGDDLRLSYAQQRLWFLDQLEPGLAAYNMTRALRVTGALDVNAVERAFNEIVRRHAALRTRFTVIEGAPVQVIIPHVEIPLPIVNLQDGNGPETRAQSFITDFASRPFDLAHDALIRTWLLRFSATEHIILISIHHIVSDQWSISVLLRELGELYAAYAAGAPSPLPELPIQYVDFSSWQRKQLESDRLDGLVSYWKECLRDLPPALELPRDHPRPHIANHEGATRTFTIDRTLTSRLELLGRRDGATLFMTLLTGFQILLHRCAGVDDVVVGAPIAGRQVTETEHLIGFFVNTLALRTSLEGNPTVRELLARVRATALGAYAHQDLPFEYLVELLRPERSRSHSPIVQVVFSLQNVPLSDIRLPGLVVTSERVDNGTAKFDLAFTTVQMSEGLAGRIEYNTSIFEARTIERLAKRFLTILAAMVDDAETPIAMVPILDAEEGQKLLIEWNDTATEYPRNACLHELFERHVEQTPDAVAVEDNVQALSYAELNRRANQLAHGLQGAGVGTGDFVAVCMERSAELIVALLAILKAGAGYVPLDPRAPRERLALMMGDARVRAVVTDTRLADRLPVPDGALLLLLDRVDGNLSNEHDENPRHRSTAEGTAYVIYTSGSTGRPKGVIVPHRAAARMVINTNYIGFRSSDAVAQAASASFDASMIEIWGALLHGARLVIIPEHVVLSAKDLAAELARTRITVLVLTTSVFNMIGRQCPDAFDTLTYLLVGGEVMDPVAARAVAQRGRVRLLNGYGPTETATIATWHEVKEASNCTGTIPIGRPVANARVYVLDQHLKPAPIGTSGEICIGGDGVARGYLNDPNLTAARFVPDPFSSDSSARLYKTGDIGRVLADGNIEFLGRRDHQVKIRGFRVETGDIQSALDTSPLVRESLVLAQEDASGAKRLIAYVVPANNETGVIAKLRIHAREKLPEYMVPSAWILLDQLPLTINGKLNRAALPAPDVTSLGATDERPPRDVLEMGVLTIWERLLEQHPISLSANFFDLGGHSLLAARLCALIEETFGTKVPLATFFEAATIEQQAEFLRQQHADKVWPSLVPIRIGGTKPPLYCVHAVGGNVLTFRDLARCLPGDQPVYGLQSQGLDGTAPIYTRIEEMASHYVAEIRKIQPHGPYAIGGLSFGGAVAYEMARQLEYQGERVALLAMFDTSAPGRQRVRAQRNLSSYRARVALHLRNLIFGPNRGLYLYWKLRGLSGDRLWQMVFSSGTKSKRSTTRVIQDVRQANQLARRRYAPQSYGGRVTLFRAIDRDPNPSGPHYGWNALAAAVEVHDVPGNHNTIVQEPAVRSLATKLAQCLDNAWQPDRVPA